MENEEMELVVDADGGVGSASPQVQGAAGDGAQAAETNAKREKKPFLSISADDGEAVEKSRMICSMRTKRLMQSIAEGRHPCMSDGEKSQIRSAWTRGAFRGEKLLQVQEAFSAPDSPFKDKRWSQIVLTKGQMEAMGATFDRKANLVPVKAKDGREFNVPFRVPMASAGYAEGDEKKERLLFSPVYEYYAAEQAVDSGVVLRHMNERGEEALEYERQKLEREGKSMSEKFDFSQFKGETVEAKSSDPVSYLGAYLAACKMGAAFRAGDGVRSGFQAKVATMLENNREQGKRHLALAEFSGCCAKAEATAKAIANEKILEKVQEKNRPPSLDKTKPQERGQGQER